MKKKKQNGKSLFLIQQFNSFLKIWSNTYISKYDYDSCDFNKKRIEFDTPEHAKRILQEHIDKYYKNKIKNKIT